MRQLTAKLLARLAFVRLTNTDQYVARKAYPCHAPHSHGCASVAATLSQRPSLLPSTHDYVRSNTFQARLYRKESQPWFGTPYHLA
ncbi:hypothetical protein AB1N83_005560 [Pleurotus pulmonarius]